MRRLTRWTLVLFPAAIAAACSGAPPAPAPSPTPSPAPRVDQPPAPNTLTDAERSAGWRLLFDGQTTSGWRGFRRSDLPAGWRAIGGALTRDGAAGDAITTEEFANFELAIEWQIVEGGNSGVMYRVSETASELTFFSGPEMQVIDNARNPDGGTALSSAGACYDMYAPSSDVVHPPGAWNQTRIVASGAHIEHWLNGVKVVEYELGSADWLARKEKSIFREVPTYGREPRGHIALQDHGERVAYRSIKIRPLS